MFSVKAKSPVCKESFLTTQDSVLTAHPIVLIVAKTRTAFVYVGIQSCSDPVWFIRTQLRLYVSSSITKRDTLFLVRFHMPLIHWSLME